MVAFFGYFYFYWAHGVVQRRADNLPFFAAVSFVARDLCRRRTLSWFQVRARRDTSAAYLNKPDSLLLGAC